MPERMTLDLTNLALVNASPAPSAVRPVNERSEEFDRAFDAAMEVTPADARDQLSTSDPGQGSPPGGLSGPPRGGPPTDGSGQEAPPQNPSGSGGSPNPQTDVQGEADSLKPNAGAETLDSLAPTETEMASLLLAAGWALSAQAALEAPAIGVPTDLTATVATNAVSETAAVAPIPMAEGASKSNVVSGWMPAKDDAATLQLAPSSASPVLTEEPMIQIEGLTRQGKGPEIAMAILNGLNLQSVTAEWATSEAVAIPIVNADSNAELNTPSALAPATDLSSNETTPTSVPTVAAKMIGDGAQASGTDSQLDVAPMTTTPGEDAPVPAGLTSGAAVAGNAKPEGVIPNVDGGDAALQASTNPVQTAVAVKANVVAKPAGQGEAPSQETVTEPESVVQTATHAVSAASELEQGTSGDAGSEDGMLFQSPVFTDGANSAKDTAEGLPVTPRMDGAPVGSSPVNNGTTVATVLPTQPLTEAEQREVMQQTLDRLDQLSLQRPLNQMVIRLAPEGLGQISVVVKTLGMKHEAEITASNDRVIHALESARPHLIQALDAKGVSLGSLTLQFGFGQSGAEAWGDPSQSNFSNSSHRQSESNGSTTDRADAVDTTTVALPLSGALNLVI